MKAKVGNACHGDYSHIMGNSRRIGIHPCYVVVGSRCVTIPSAWIAKNGAYKKRYCSAIQSMIAGARKARVAA